MGLPRIPGWAGDGLAVPAEGDFLGRDDKYPEAGSGTASAFVFPGVAGIGAEAGIARHDAEVSLEAGGWGVH